MTRLLFRPHLALYADAIGEYLRKAEELGLKESEVLVIHTDRAGEIIGLMPVGDAKEVRLLQTR